jgi:hypothetical protein
MVNYDKWDTLEVSDDEEDTASRRATVTRLDAPSRVTFGGGVGKNAIEVASSSADVVTPGAAAAAATKRAPASSFHGTDYARFDAIARDVSDDEEEAREYYEDEAWEKARGKKPPSSSFARDDPPPVSGSRTTADETARQRVRETRTEAFSENGGVESSAPGADASATTVDGPVSEKKNNGASGVALMWSQTKEEVTLSVVVPPGTRASDVAVRCTSDRVEVAVTAKREGKTDENTAAAAAAAACFLSDAWTHPIDPEPNDDDDDDVFGNVFGDWEVCDWDPDGSRVVRVTARKKTIGNSLVHWWNRGVKSGVPIDVAAIAARRDNKKNVARAEEARRVWDEATEAFKKKVKDREKITIHV